MKISLVIVHLEPTGMIQIVPRPTLPLVDLPVADNVAAMSNNNYGQHSPAIAATIGSLPEKSTPAETRCRQVVQVLLLSSKLLIATMWLLCG